MNGLILFTEKMNPGDNEFEVLNIATLYYTTS